MGDQRSHYAGSLGTKKIGFAWVKRDYLLFNSIFVKYQTRDQLHPDYRKRPGLHRYTSLAVDFVWLLKNLKFPNRLSQLFFSFARAFSARAQSRVEIRADSLQGRTVAPGSCTLPQSFDFGLFLGDGKPAILPGAATAQCWWQVGEPASPLFLFSPCFLFCSRGSRHGVVSAGGNGVQGRATRARVLETDTL